MPTSEKGQKSFGTSLNCLELRPVSESVWTVPKGIFHQILYYIIYPIKIIIYYTIPDAKEPGAGNRAIMSIIMSVIWMAIQSYVIIKGLDEIGNLIQVGGTVMGLTIGAIAASYPALWSSIVVAREGNADIALCNALGSNVFNNFLGLGLPWLTYSIVYNNNPYSGIQNNGVVLAFIILNVILFAFYLVVAFNSFELNYK